MYLKYNNSCSFPHMHKNMEKIQLLMYFLFQNNLYINNIHALSTAANVTELFTT